jgi:hypothetical protein
VSVNVGSGLGGKALFVSMYGSVSLWPGTPASTSEDNPDQDAPTQRWVGAR